MLRWEMVPLQTLNQQLALFILFYVIGLCAPVPYNTFCLYLYKEVFHRLLDNEEAFRGLVLFVLQVTHTVTRAIRQNQSRTFVRGLSRIDGDITFEGLSLLFDSMQ